MARPKELLVDKRIYERNIEKGLISEANYQKHLDGLADAESNGEFVAVETAEEEAPVAEAEEG